MGNTKKYITDLIKDDYKTWQNTKIVLSAGTGTGKTTFIFEVLAPYAKECRRRLLYLCNRKELELQVKLTAANYDNVDIYTYQRLQECLKKNIPLKKYDYIVADECHYFMADANFNEYTDLSYNFLVSQKNNVIIYMSASAHTLFKKFITDGIVKESHIYKIPPSYSHVDKCYLFDKEELVDIIDHILEFYPNDKILIFVNSIERLHEMHEIYGSNADYLCSRSQKLSFVNYNAIHNKKFEKRMLFTTKALDNGIDIIDPDLCHIITELFDIESTLQAIGRKRPIDMLDECRLYFRKFNNISLARYLKSVEKQLHPVNEYLRDKETFISNLENNYADSRNLARSNTIFYTDWKDETKLKINYMALAKFEQDHQIIEQMISTSYEDVLFKYIGQELKDKLCEVEISTISKDKFMDYLKNICGKKLFKEEQNQLKSAFKNLLGTRCRTLGMQTLNGQLEDLGYNYKIFSKRELCRTSKYFKKRYWQVEKIV